jgi:hypothetical protein
MRRFFCIFSIILILFLFLAAGSVVAVDYGSVTASRSNTFIAGWGITAMPYYGKAITLAEGDVFIIKSASADDVKPYTVVLYSGAGGSAVQSGYVNVVTDSKLNIEFSGSVSSDVPLSGVVGIYKFAIPHMAEILDVVRKPLAVCIFAAVLLLSVILWRSLPKKGRASGKLSKSDEEIASNLY